MKKFFRSVGKMFKPFVNFPRWMGLQQITQSAQDIKEIAKETFTIPAARPKETFEAAAQRFGLDEQALQVRTQWHLRMTWMYVVFSVLIFAYMVYLLIQGGHIFAISISIILWVLALAYAYREHVRYIMLKQRKLGLTFPKWFSLVFKGKAL